MRSVLVLALPSLLYRGEGGKGTERLRNMLQGAQQCLGRAGFRLGRLGPESTCLPTGLTYCLLVWREQRLHGCDNVTTCCDRDVRQGRVGLPVSWLTQACTSQCGPLWCLGAEQPPRRPFCLVRRWEALHCSPRPLELGGGRAQAHLFGIRHELSTAGQKPAPQSQKGFGNTPPNV